jgi:hypothetical protein
VSLEKESGLVGGCGFLGGGEEEVLGRVGGRGWCGGVGAEVGRETGKGEEG